MGFKSSECLGGLGKTALGFYGLGQREYIGDFGIQEKTELLTGSRGLVSRL